MPIDVEALRHIPLFAQLGQEELEHVAALAGTAREVVGRALKELETAGAIEMRQGRAVVVNAESLHMLSSG